MSKPKLMSHAEKLKIVKEEVISELMMFTGKDRETAKLILKEILSRHPLHLDKLASEQEIYK